MKGPKCWKVVFEINNRSEEVFACCKTEAIILAQAEQIKKGNRYNDVRDAYTLD